MNVPTYTYEVITTGELVEVEQRITELAHTVLELDGELRTVRRVIVSAPRFNLVSGAAGGWSNTGYAKPEHERKAEATLGRPLFKAAK